MPVIITKIDGTKEYHKVELTNECKRYYVQVDESQIDFNILSGEEVIIHSMEGGMEIKVVGYKSKDGASVKNQVKWAKKYFKHERSGFVKMIEVVLDSIDTMIRKVFAIAVAVLGFIASIVLEISKASCSAAISFAKREYQGLVRIVKFAMAIIFSPVTAIIMLIEDIRDEFKANKANGVQKTVVTIACFPVVAFLFLTLGFFENVDNLLREV